MVKYQLEIKVYCTTIISYKRTKERNRIRDGSGARMTHGATDRHKMVRYRDIIVGASSHT